MHCCPPASSRQTTLSLRHFCRSRLGTDNFEESLSLDLLENQDRILDEVNDALARIDEGTFGRCENCGQEISIRRLNALPYARHCVACAKKFEARPPR